MKEQIAQLKCDKVHLVVDLKTTKNNTLNLLEEELLPALNLAHYALNKPTPKIEQALYRIELAMDAIHENLKKFEV
jgi:hypothetical protein